MRLELSQYPLICRGEAGGVAGRWVKYCSKKEKAASNPKPSALPEWVLCWELGTVLPPVQSTWVVVEIIQEKALCLCQFRDASLTTRTEPVAAVKYCWRVVTGWLGTGSIFVHSSGAYLGNVDWIWWRIKLGLVFSCDSVKAGMGSTSRVIQKPLRWVSRVMGYWVGVRFSVGWWLGSTNVGMFGSGEDIAPLDCEVPVLWFDWCWDQECGSMCGM